MHSHDRTLLAGLSFGDKDKQDLRHDMGCRYLAQPEIGEQLFKRYNRQKFETGEIISCKVARTAIDHHITKGDHQYKTTIGFADLIIEVQSYTSKEHYDYNQFLIEVKINQLPIGDLIRQLNLYREYMSPYGGYSGYTIAACAFNLSQSEIETLNNEYIRFVHLGENFEKYCAAQALEAENAEALSARFDI